MMMASSESTQEQRTQTRNRAGAVSDATVHDGPTAHDSLGFAPYTSAIARFLLSPNSRLPFTLSIEGEWGCGKTSFMRQLEQALHERSSVNGHPKPLCFWFDAWRSEGAESVWSSFAYEFVRFLASHTSPLRGALSAIRLDWARFDRVAATKQIAWVVLSWAIFLLAFAGAIFGGSFAGNLLVRIPGMIFAILIAVVAGRAAITKTSNLVGNPLQATLDLLKFVYRPGYASRRAFRTLFAEDLPRILDAYIPVGQRLFIFVDDVDRADPNEAAELIGALSILLATQDPRLAFVVGIDRRKVAAGIALRNEGALPYLYPDTDESAMSRVGLDYGYEFLEKFIQLPFRVPHPTPSDIERFVHALSETPYSPAQTTVSEELERLEVELSTDSDTVRDIVTMVADVLDANPRRIKQFLNVFRLRSYIASETGMLSEELTLQQLGIVVAVTLRWPRLLEILQHDSHFLRELQSEAVQEEESDETAEWHSKKALVNLLFDASHDPRYSLSETDIATIMQISPLYRPTFASGPDVGEFRIEPQLDRPESARSRTRRKGARIDVSGSDSTAS